MSRHALDALVLAALIATLGLASLACGPDVPEGTVREMRVEGRAGIVTVEGTERYADGEWRKHGTFVFRDDRGDEIATGSYSNGLETGDWTETYEDGSTGRGNYAEGSRTGEWNTFHSNGSLQDRGNYDRGLRTGRWVSFRADRTRLREAEYRGGELNGEVVYYGPDGRTWEPERSGVYKGGKKVADLDR